MNRSTSAIYAGLLLCFVFLGGACGPVNPPGEADVVAPDESVVAARGTEFSSSDSLEDAPAQGDEGSSSEDVKAEAATSVSSDPGDPPSVPLTQEELDEGWIALFDGETLFGWKAASEADWRVRDGAIVVSTGQKGLLYTTTQFADYVLRLDFRSDPETNSGVFLHTPPSPQDPETDCYELNIAGADNPFPTGSLVGREKAEVDVASGQWHSYEVTLQGAEVLVSLDGRQILEYTDPQPLQRGHIGLQLNEGKAAFRNIRLKPLGLESAFNSMDLTGWKSYPEMASEFTVTDEGELNVKDGRGQLETEASFGDFVLQLQCKTNARHLNSGIFFRCIPGDVMMGYECQIHNGFEDDDRSRPIDCGTGGIFRRQDARYVAADDLEWFCLTLVVDGPHMAAWTNGLQVSDWTDDRPADQNPRKGLRLASGTIMIQGHDPTTDISFRQLRLGEMASRPYGDF